MINLIKKKGINPQTKEVIYFPQWTRISTVDEKQLSKRMARGSTYSVGEVSGVMRDFPAHIIDELLDGNAVRIDGLGTFKLRVSGKARTDVREVTSAGASVSVSFEPDPELTARLNSEREFRFVVMPTAEGAQDAEETNPTDLTPGSGSTPTDSTANQDNTPGGNGGGGQDQDQGQGGNGGNTEPVMEP